MNMPKRIQLSRRKGWRKPEGAVVVSRPSKWGNPFRNNSPFSMYIGDLAGGLVPLGVANATQIVAFYRGWLVDRIHLNEDDEFLARRDAIYASINELRGKDLCCWCPLDQPCHADVLLELANT